MKLGHGPFSSSSIIDYPLVHSSLQFEFSEPPVVTSMYPQAGSWQGNELVTLNGENLAFEELYCVFGASAVRASVLSSTGKKPHVAPYSGAMLAIVALSGKDNAAIPRP